MNKRERVAVKAAADVLSALDLKVETESYEASTGRSRSGATVVVRYDRRVARYNVEYKSTVTRATIGTLLFRHPIVPDDLLLITEHVTAPLADELRRHHIQFVDTAGNAYLQREGLLVFISGKKPMQKPGIESRSRAFQESGLKLIFALLTKPELVETTFRTISSTTGTAVGTVHWVMKDLRGLGFVAEVGRRRRLLDRERLIEEWTEAYARVLRPKLLLGRFSSSESDWWARASIQSYAGVWGGDVAAARLTHSLKAGTTTIYATTVPHRLVVDHRLKPDPQGRTEIRKRFWDFHDEWEEKGLAPPLLTYADLLAAGDSRSVKTARLIHERYLSGPVG